MTLTWRNKNLRDTCGQRFASWIRSNLSYLSSQVQVWDTAGQERFRKSMVKHYYHNVHAVVFVYDVTNMASFCNLQTWIEVVSCSLIVDYPLISGSPLHLGIPLKHQS